MFSTTTYLLLLFTFSSSSYSFFLSSSSSSPTCLLLLFSSSQARFSPFWPQGISQPSSEGVSGSIQNVLSGDMAAERVMEEKIENFEQIDNTMNKNIKQVARRR